MSGVKLAPSILSADFATLGEQVCEAERAGAQYIHVDVMDGAFVPNLTIGPAVVEAIRRSTILPLDVHLMIEEPRRYLSEFARAGASILTIHQEADRHLHRTLSAIRELGVRAGLAINPATPLVTVEDVLDEVDLLLVMTVNPGFGGQAFIPGVMDKIARARRMIDARGARTELEVDGGIKPENARQVAACGADVLVAGSAIFNREASVAANTSALRAAADAGWAEREAG